MDTQAPIMDRRRSRKLVKELAPFEKEWGEIIERDRELVLSNLALLAEVPAQTFHERERAALILDRYAATPLHEPRTDEMDNVIGTLCGAKGDHRILVFAHMDHQFPATVSQNTTITQDRAIGMGVAEDTLAVATLISLPDIIDSLQFSFENDIVLVATTRSHGRGDFAGIRHFMEDQHKHINYSVNLDGLSLGKINYFSLSRVRCDIGCEINAAQGSPWGKITNTSAIMIMNEVINHIYNIPIPRQPKTVLNIGMIAGGERYSTVSTRASIRLEVLSENDDIMESIIEEIHDRCVDVGAKYGVEVTTEFFGRHVGGGLSYSHPLVKSTAAIVRHLGYQPVIEYSNAELAVPIAHNIPSVNIGITTGMITSRTQGYVDIHAIPTGVLQLIMLLYAVDRGFCDE